MSFRINELKVMFGSTDYKTRIEDEETYMHYKEDFNGFAKERGFETMPGGNMEATWFYEMLDYQHHPCNRIMAVLPLAVYQVQHNKLTKDMIDELVGAKEDLETGLLDQLPEEERVEIRKDLDFCFSKIK